MVTQAGLRWTPRLGCRPCLSCGKLPALWLTEAHGEADPCVSLSPSLQLQPRTPHGDASRRFWSQPERNKLQGWGCPAYSLHPAHGLFSFSGGLRVRVRFPFPSRESPWSGEGWPLTQPGAFVGGKGRVIQSHLPVRCCDSTDRLARGVCSCAYRVHHIVTVHAFYSHNAQFSVSNRSCTSLFWPKI